MSETALPGWFALYLRVEVEPGSETLSAKRRDLQIFLDFFVRTMGADRADLWTPAITKAFQKELRKVRKATTANRVLATIRHASSWVNRHRPFPAGHPCYRVQELQIDEPTWKGLTPHQV